MKKTIIGAIAVAGICVSMAGCIRVGESKSKDYGEKVSKTINVTEDFNSIESTGLTDIEFAQGPLSLTLEAPEKLIDKIDIEVKGGVLKVGERKGFEVHNLSNFQNVKLIVSAPSVGTFITSGTGDIDLKRLNVKEISIVSNGTGDVELQTARCTKFSAMSHGTGDIEIKHLSCVVAECSTSGTGDITFERLVADRLSGTTSGVGDITVSGECKEANLTSSGTGDINRRGLEITDHTEASETEED